MSIFKQIAFILAVIILSFLVGYAISQAWTEPTTTPPGNNVSAPVNISTTAQTKQGALQVTADFTANRLLDTSDNSYYVDPANTGYAGLFAGNVGIGTVTPNNRIQVTDLINFDNSIFGTFLGNEAGKGATGDYNTAVGYKALHHNTTGVYNTALGSYALYDDTTGSFNAALGHMTLQFNTTGNYNTALGDMALQHNTTGVYNTALGLQAGENITTGSRNIIIGYSIDAQSATGSSQLSIGNLIFAAGGFGTGTTVGTGNVGIGTTSPQTKLDVAGAIKIGTQDTCNFGTEGAIRYNSVRNKFEGCNGVVWENIESMTDPWAKTCSQSGATSLVLTAAESTCASYCSDVGGTYDRVECNGTASYQNQYTSYNWHTCTGSGSCTTTTVCKPPYTCYCK